MSDKKKHIIALVLFYGYVSILLWITIFSRQSPTGKNMLMHPLWEYIALFKNISWHAARDIVMNMLLFIPYGFIGFLPSNIENTLLFWRLLYLCL